MLSAMVVLLVALPLVLCSGAYAKKEPLKEGEQININTASKVELMRLPGIGTKKADKIIANRPYANAAELRAKKVGVGEKTLAKWGDHVTFDKAAEESKEAATETKAKSID
ncbi:MAG: helix-hairpin-helix domain-containing protein [bacterium]